jgi:uncharacterized protein
MERSSSERPETASRVIPSSNYVRERWRNGAGWTREIHRAAPANGCMRGSVARDWDWRISIAELESAGPFSTFPGVERESVLLHGNGVRLLVDGAEECALLPPHGRCRYRGESAVQGQPVDGAAEVFNLMWYRDAVSARLWHRPLVGPMVVFVEPGSVWVVHLMSGSARISREACLPSLAGGDTALLTAEVERRRYMLEGGGEVLLAHIEAVDPARDTAGIAASPN